MTRKLLWLMLFWGFRIGFLEAQFLPTVQGKVQDINGTPLEAATVVLLALPDSTVSVYSLTNSQGLYTLKTQKGAYLLQISYLGYQSISIPIDLQRDTSLGKHLLQVMTDTLQLVEVRAEHIPVQMNGDTLSFNSAAFNVRSQDDAGQLLRQLPGLRMQENGTILFNGQKVTEVLVDGKVFYGDDAQATLRALSADAIKKIDVTETKVDSKGNEPKEEQKTINLHLKETAKTGMAGKAMLGYGHLIPPTGTPPTVQNFEDHRYQASGDMTYFSSKIRTAFYAHSHNVQPSDIYTTIQTAAAGLIRTHNAGATFNWMPSTATAWNTMYRWTQPTITQKEGYKETSILPKQSFQRLRQRSQFNTPINHHFSSNLRHKINDKYLIKARLMAYYSSTKGQTTTTEHSFEQGVLQNDLQQQYQRNQRSFLLAPMVGLEKKFDKKGRQLTINIATKWSNRPSNSHNKSFTNFYTNNHIVSLDTLLQRQEHNNEQQTYNASVVWKEPFGKVDKIYFTLKGGWEYQKSTQTGLDWLDGAYRINTTLSNAYQNYSNYQDLLVSWRRTTKKYRTELTAGTRRSFLYGVSAQNKVKQELYLPTGQAQFRYTFDRGKNLTFTYNLYLVELTLNQLRPFVDNANPLEIRLGNSRLKPTINHHLSLRFNWFEQQNFSTIYTRVSSLLTPNTIVQKQEMDAHLRLVSQPVNSGLSSRFDVTTGYNRLFQALNLVTDVSIGAERAQQPLLLNGENQQQTTYNYTIQFKLSNKKRKYIDWGIEAQLNGGLLHYTNLNEARNNYVNQYYGGHIGVEFLKYWEAQTILGLQWYAPTQPTNDRQSALWSLAVKRYWGKSKQLEFELRAENLLNASTRLQRFQQEQLLVEQQMQSLGRYILLSCRYKFRNKK